MNTLRLAVVLLATFTAASAQEVRKIALRTLCLQPPPDVTELWLPAATAKDKPLTIPLYASSLSAVSEASFKGGEAVFFSPADKSKPLARGPLATSKHQLHLLVPAKVAGGPALEVRAFDDDAEVFKLGSVRAINLAPEAIRFTFAGTALPVVAPGGHAIFPQAKTTDEFGMYPVIAEVQGADQAWTKVYSASWKASDRRREIVFVEFDDTFKQWSVKLMTDVPPWMDP